MKIVVDMNHPAHVHYFKHFIKDMKKRGHEVLVTASEKKIIFDLLDKYNLEYSNAGNYGHSLTGKIFGIPFNDIKYIKIVKKYNPDVLMGFGSIRAAHVASMLGKPCINFEDTEHSTEQIRLYLPFVNAVCTPSCYNGNLGKKQIRFNSYMELASLHPRRFTPKKGVIQGLDLDINEPFIVVRFVSWNASHDIGHQGICSKVKLVKELEKYGNVLITGESELPQDLMKYQIRTSPDNMHDILANASLYIGEGATMASESALLGTPSIYISSLAGTMGCLKELEQKYGALHSFIDEEAALNKAKEILKDQDSKKRGELSRERIVNEKIDLTAFMIWLIENYPSSIKEMKDNPDLWTGPFTEKECIDV